MEVTGSEFGRFGGDRAAAPANAGGTDSALALRSEPQTAPPRATTGRPFQPTSALSAGRAHSVG